MLGLGQGTTRGGASSVGIVVYKCYGADLLATFDDAIADRVDIVSVPLGGESNHYNYSRDALSIGSFHAMANGILTVFAVGNKGTDPASIYNVSLWSIAVAASTIDMKFVTKVQLGDNRNYEGISLNTFDLKGELYPIIYAGDALNTEVGFNGHSSRICSTNSLDHKLVMGKIVLCGGNTNVSGAFEVSVVGFVTQGHTSTVVAFSFPLLGFYLEMKDADNIHEYIQSSSRI